MGASIRSGQTAQLANGIRLHYASAGQAGAPLVLFLHGFPEFWGAWQDQLGEFGDDYFAVAPDLRGFNLSDQPADADQYLIQHIVEDLRLLVAQLGYKKFVLVAHDWGGAVAWNFANALPELLERLIIINSPHPYLFAQALVHDPLQRAASDYMNWLRAAGSETALEKNDFALTEGFFSRKGQPAWYSPATREQYHACWTHGLLGGVNYYRASPLHPPTPEDPAPALLTIRKEDFRVRVPTMVIWGEQDQALPTSLLDGLEELVDQVRIERIPEGSHWVVHEQPARINQLLRQFLTAP